MSTQFRRFLVSACMLVLAVGGLAACGSDDSSDSADTADTSDTTTQTSGTSDCGDVSPPVVDDGFVQPEVRVSENGRLETTLRASYGEVEINGETVKTLNYEGSVPGPTLVVCPGDTLVVHLENDLGSTPADWMDGVSPEHDVPHDLGQVTNLHTHGFHVSPEGNSDNVFVTVETDDAFTYEYQIPEDHPPGMYWYHPHRHGFVDTQIDAGMFGAIYVNGGLDLVPEIADVPTRTLVLNSFEVADDSGEKIVVNSGKAQNPQTYVNGVLNPSIDIAPGELQRWRIVNVGPDDMVNLGLEGHDLYVLANDGNTLEKMSPESDLLIGPGERKEVLVQGGEEGSYKLESLEFGQFQGTPSPATTLATVHSTGTAVDEAVPVDASLVPPEEDLRLAEVSSQYTITYSEKDEADGTTEFLFNGAIFDPERVDVSMTLDEVTEFVLVNETTEWHTFHIHVNWFQVTDVQLGDVKDVSTGRVRDVAMDGNDREDTVKLPPGATVTLRTRPTDFTGKFVYHCHMVFHEDNGMMGIVEVVPGE